jgi:thiamine transport system substrate-binding protein
MKQSRLYRLTILPAAVVPMALLLVGCGGSTSSGSVSAKPTVVRLLAHDSFAVSDSLKADFEKATGLTLDVVTAGDAGTMVAGAVLAAGSPTADVMFGADNTLVSRATKAGVFWPYQPPDLSTLLPALKSDTSGGLVTPVDYGDVCVNIDDAWFKAKGLAAPKTLEDLTMPQYKNLLVVEDPAASSTGLAFLLATVARYGTEWQKYWSRLKDNGVTVASTWTDAYEGTFTAGGKNGDRPLVVSYATSPPAEIVYAADPKPAKPSTSVMTDGCYRQVEYAGVLAGAANPSGAQKVIDWLISQPVQADAPLSMFVFPARSGVALPEVFTKFAAKVDSPLMLDPTAVAAGLDGWLADWGTVMGR